MKALLLKHKSTVLVTRKHCDAFVMAEYYNRKSGAHHTRSTTLFFMFPTKLFSVVYRLYVNMVNE